MAGDDMRPSRAVSFAHHIDRIPRALMIRSHSCIFADIILLFCIMPVDLVEGLLPNACSTTHTLSISD